MRARFYCRETTGFAYACKALYYRHARPVAQVRFASRKNFTAGCPQAGLFQHRQMFSRSVFLHPVLMCSTIFTASFPAIFWRSRNGDICKSSSYAITHLHHSAESDKQKQALSHRLACYGLCCGMSQQLVCNRVWICSFPSYCVSSLFAFDRTRRLLQKLKKSTSQMNSKKCSHSIAKPVAYSFELRHSS